MRVLGIDTHGSIGGAALLDGGRVLSQVHLSVRATHSEQVLPTIELVLGEMLGHSGGPPVDAIAVASGPGSFTGLRIGVVTAKALAYAWRVPVVGVNTLEALAFQTRWFAPLQVGLVSSRGERLFGGAYAFSGTTNFDQYTEPTHVVEPGPYVIDDLLERVAETGLPAVFSGEAVPTFADRIKERLGERLVMAPPLWQQLHSATVAHLGRLMLEAGKGSDAFALVPEYLRKAEAEIRWQSRFKS